MPPLRLSAKRDTGVLSIVCKDGLSDICDTPS